ncbi:MAG: DUF5606 domain-containing protein [Bacteroidaceae bacterium]|nr:DUF5606 domain-containing protein [Bacteroidaceae bacterium]MBQ9177249.1 DUF5606 domain-containing protein [Bacteroidaceae bacterium]MBR1378142.1 DUF5606 domain-containing protein [Bacteroidaceae bacterium]
MMKEILAISGKPGLYKLVSRGNKMLIVETLDERKHRMPAYATDRVVAVADISIYTDDGEDTPLPGVFESIRKLYDGKTVDINHKKADNDEIIAFFKKALPNYDTDRVRVSDMRKVIAWYNILVAAGVTEFVEEEKTDSDGV